MADEILRTQSRKEIITDVWVPIIETITFRDVSQRGQESTFTFDNSNGNQMRWTHVKLIGDASLEVERIDRFTIMDFVQRGQESRISIINTDPPPATADTVGLPPSHWFVQYIRYCANNDPTAGAWVDVEQIVVLHDIDFVERGQQAHYVLNGWPDASQPIDDASDPFNPAFAECDMSLPIADYSDTGIDPPWRLDPFQNIVDATAGAVEFYPGLT